jgi:hypothetical protein
MASGRSAVSAPLTYRELYQGLEQTRLDIKSIRGFHGSNLAIAGGVVGGVVVAGAGVAAVIASAGLAAIPIAAVAGGVAIGAAGAGVGLGAGYAKTWWGKHQCRNNPLLMAKIALLVQIKAEMKKHKASFSPEQKRLYKDLRKVRNKVDRSSLKEAGKMLAKSAAGATGGAVGVVLVAAVATLAVASGGGGGGDGCFCWGTPNVSLGGNFSGGGHDPLSSGINALSGVGLTPAQLDLLRTPIAAE